MEKKDLLILAIAILLILAGLYIGECVTALSCEGKYHIACVGQWGCINKKCVWQCSSAINITGGDV